jgi:hypothetical protein
LLQKYELFGDKNSNFITKKINMNKMWSKLESKADLLLKLCSLDLWISMDSSWGPQQIPNLAFK